MDGLGRSNPVNESREGPWIIVAMSGGRSSGVAPSPSPGASFNENVRTQLETGLNLAQERPHRLFSNSPENLNMIISETGVSRRHSLLEPVSVSNCLSDRRY
jgi:hypothetical protein